MVQGFDRREAVQDPQARNLSQRVQRQELPGAPVVTPRGADFSQVGAGQRAIGKLLGAASDSYNNWYNKKVDQWKLDGQMAYAEGKTEEELAKTGNRYTMSGFQSMKARAAFNTWETQAQDDIAKNDYTMSSADYQKKLSDTYKTVVDSLDTEDEDVKGLIGAMSERSFPTLVAKQISANNSWRETETYNSRTGLLYSEAKRPGTTEQELKELLDHPAGLNDEQRKKSNLEAITFGLKNGDDRLYRAAGLTERDGVKLLDSSGATPPGLTAAVMAVESRGNRNAVSPKGAKSEMQVMDATNTDPGYGVRPADPNAKDQLAERARVGRDYLAAMVNKYGDVRLALMAYNGGPGNLDAHIQKVGDPSQGRIPILDFIKSYPLKETRDYVAKVMSKWQGQEGAVQVQAPEALQAQNLNEAASIQSLVKQGYSLADLSTVSQAYEAYQTKKSQEFDQNRIMQEQAIYDDARKNGNLAQSLQYIETTKQKNNYSDAWANAQVSKVQSQIKEYEKERTENLELSHAINNNSVGQLSGEKRQKAIDMNRVALQGQAQAQGINYQTPEGQDVIDGRQRDFLVRNNVVDDTWKGTMTSNLAFGNVVNKEGRVNEGSLKAYRDWRQFNAVGGLAYADQYLDENSRKLVHTALEMDSGQNSEQALIAASAQLSRANNDTGFTPKTASQKEISEVVNEKMDKLDPGFWAFVSPYQAADTFDIGDADIAAAKESPVLRSAVTAETNRILAQDTSGTLTPSAAASMAMSNLQGRVELMPGGNVLIGGRDTTIRQDAGFPSANANNLMYKAMQGFLQENGKVLWGEDYHGKTIDADRQYKLYKEQNPNDPDATGKDERGIFGKTRDEFANGWNGIPPMKMYYDADRKAIVMDLLKENDDGELVPMNRPKPVPAMLLGDWMRDKKFQERSMASMSEAHKELIRANRKLPEHLRGIPTMRAGF